MKFLITGGSGFLGRALTHYLEQNAENKLTWVSRHVSKQHPKNVELITYEQLKKTDKKFDIIVNLAGAGIADKRWTGSQKQRLIDSRLKPTQAALDYIQQVAVKPKLFISGSATGWYGIQDKVLNEQSSAHDEFTHELCDRWEKLALTATEFDVPTKIIRTGVVMSPSGGMVAKLRLPFSLGAGGKSGDGQQFMSWISLTDWVRAVDFIIEQSLSANDSTIIYNLTAPNAIKNADFTKAMGQWLKRSTFFTQPEAVIKLIFAEMSVLLLGNQQIVPQALLDSGFDFEHKDISQALRASHDMDAS